MGPKWYDEFGPGPNWYESEFIGFELPDTQKPHVNGVPFSHPYPFVSGNFHPSVYTVLDS